MSIEMTEGTKVDTLQFLLLVGRLEGMAGSVLEHFVGRTEFPAVLSMEACMMFAGLGLHWPLPCLARRFDGVWFSVDDVEDEQGRMRQQ